MKKLNVDFTYGAAALSALLILNNHTKTIVPLIFAVIIHEFGHAAAIVLFGGKIESLSFNAGGLKIDYNSSFLSYYQDIICALMGPLSGLISAFAASYLGCTVFAGISFCISIFNLIPVRPLDGGRILWNLSMLLSDNGTQFVYIIEIAFLVLIWLASVYVSIISQGNISLIIIAALLTFYYCKER